MAHYMSIIDLSIGATNVSSLHFSYPVTSIIVVALSFKSVLVVAITWIISVTHLLSPIESISTVVLIDEGSQTSPKKAP